MSSIQAQTRLVLNGATMNISQGAFLVIENSGTNAITRNSGYIISEGQSNVIKWNIGSSTGTYTIPWGYNGDYIPVSFIPSGASSNGYFLLSTYHTTDWNNANSLPAGVTNFNGAAGADQSAFAIDRFWQINTTSYSTRPTLSSLIFTYRDDEHSAPGNSIVESSLRPERWNTTLTSWTDYSASANINTTTNTIQINTLNFTDLYPWWTLTTSPVNRYWVAAALSNWNNRSNWAIAPGGQGGATVPSSADVVIFDGANDGPCLIDVDVSIASLDVQSAYSGTVNQGSHPMVVGDNATFSGGVFQGGSAVVRVIGDMAISGTAFTSSSDTLDLKKNFSFESGAFNHNNGTVKFSGTTAGSPQLLNGSSVATFNHLYITNTALNGGVSMESDQNLRGILTMAANAHLDADGSADTTIFTLLSTADDPVADAAIAALPGGAQVNGRVTVQRYMTLEGASNTRIFRYIASPVQHATVADFQEEIPVTGSFAGSSKCLGCLTNQSMFAYNETVTTEDTNNDGVVDLNDGYYDFPSDANSEEFQTGRGYSVFVRGNILPSGLWDLRGVINSGNIVPVSIPASFTSSGNIANDGWNLVGNPYPSTIDWNAASGWTKTNVGGTIYMPDNGGTTLRYAIWNGVTGINGGSRYIATGQAFWIKASASPTLQANESVKAPGQSTAYFRTPGVEDLLLVKLKNTTFEDETAIHFREDATAAFDDHADAWKLKNGGFNLSSVIKSGEQLAINSMPALLCDTRVNLSIADVRPGNYTLTFDNINSFPSDASVALEDHYLNQVIPVSAQQNNYSFEVTREPTSMGNKRFAVLVSRIAPEVVIEEESGILKIDYTGNIQWYKNGQVIEGATGTSYTPTESGTYTVSVGIGDCSLSGSKEFVITGMENGRQAIKIYPVPVSDKLYIQVDASRQLTSVTVMNVLGDEIVSADLQRGADNLYSGTVAMKDLPTGTYVIQLKGTGGIVSMKVVKK
ncbi:T9SS type A sorting domain-containing protein [Ohtaekwangia sp.]|uniref:T9SS type A sorting domain-containing protein n=1 Tax=Ohtaekwangia sp. TaxID=2066019 RepID=UPI002F94E254